MGNKKAVISNDLLEYFLENNLVRVSVLHFNRYNPVRLDLDVDIGLGGFTYLAGYQDHGAGIFYHSFRFWHLIL